MREWARRIRATTAGVVAVMAEAERVAAKIVEVVAVAAEGIPIGAGEVAPRGVAARPEILPIPSVTLVSGCFAILGCGERSHTIASNSGYSC